jgi:hypothetical protein
VLVPGFVELPLLWLFLCKRAYQIMAIFVQACFPEYGYFCAGVLSITQVSLPAGKR